MSIADNTNEKKISLKKIFLFFVPLITPVLLLSIPGYVVLFYYQIHIRNLSSFLTQINVPIFVILGIVSVFFYVLLVIYGMASSFWLYMLINFFMKKILNTSNLDKSNIITNTKSGIYCYSIGSILIFIIIVISLYTDRVNNYSISLSVYFFIVGFLSIAAVDKIPKDNFKRSLFLILSPVAAGLILPVFLQGTGPMIAEDFISIIGMRTRNFNNVYISMNEYKKIDALLKVLSGVEQSVCYISVSGREFVNIKISFGKEKDSIPLVVLWNDNSDHKIVGFDNRWTPNGPFEFPTFSISNNDFFELPKKFVNNC